MHPPETELMISTGIAITVLGASHEILEIMTTHTTDYLIALVLARQSAEEPEAVLHLRNGHIIGVFQR